MSLFKNLGSDGLEEQGDYLGGGGVFESDIYTSKIKVAYMATAQSGANSINLLLDIGGKEYRENFYVTNAKGQNYFMREDKKVPLPGFTTMENLCLIVTGNTLQGQEDSCEDKVVNVWDFDAKKELPKKVPVLTGLTDQPISVAIMKILENKSEKGSDGKYTPIAEERTVNVIEAVFHPEHKLTVSEAKNGAEAPAFWEAWIKRNKGQTRDKRKIKNGQSQAGAAGRPGAKVNAGPPQSGAGQTQRKSLFGAK